MWRNFVRWLRLRSDDQKELIRHRLAFVYAFTAWNSVIIFFYLTIKDNLPTDEEKKMRFLEKMKSQNKEVEYITIHGFQLQKNEPKVETEPASGKIELGDESSLS